MSSFPSGNSTPNPNHPNVGTGQPQMQPVPQMGIQQHQHQQNHMQYIPSQGHGQAQPMRQTMQQPIQQGVHPQQQHQQPHQQQQVQQILQQPLQQATPTSGVQYWRKKFSIYGNVMKDITNTQLVSQFVNCLKDFKKDLIYRGNDHNKRSNEYFNEFLQITLRMLRELPNTRHIERNGVFFQNNSKGNDIIECEADVGSVVINSDIFSIKTCLLECVVANYSVWEANDFDKIVAIYDHIIDNECLLFAKVALAELRVEVGKICNEVKHLKPIPNDPKFQKLLSVKDCHIHEIIKFIPLLGILRKVHQIVKDKNGLFEKVCYFKYYDEADNPNMYHLRNSHESLQFILVAFTEFQLSQLVMKFVFSFHRQVQKHNPTFTKKYIASAESGFNGQLRQHHPHLYKESNQSIFNKHIIPYDPCILTKICRCCFEAFKPLGMRERTKFDKSQHFAFYLELWHFRSSLVRTMAVIDNRLYFAQNDTPGTATIENATFHTAYTMGDVYGYNLPGARNTRYEGAKNEWIQTNCKSFDDFILEYYNKVPHVPHEIFSARATSELKYKLFRRTIILATEFCRNLSFPSSALHFSPVRRKFTQIDILSRFLRDNRFLRQGKSNNGNNSDNDGDRSQIWTRVSLESVHVMNTQPRCHAIQTFFDLLTARTKDILEHSGFIDISNLSTSNLDDRALEKDRKKLNDFLTQLCDLYARIIHDASIPASLQAYATESLRLFIQELLRLLETKQQQWKQIMSGQPPAPLVPLFSTAIVAGNRILWVVLGKVLFLFSFVILIILAQNIAHIKDKTTQN